MNFTVSHGYFSYGRKEVLHDISFSLNSGEVMCILGPNGVGKTTLLRCMMGLLNWRKGESYLNNRKLEEYRQKEFWQKVAYVPQAKELVFGLSALDMVTLGRSSHIGVFNQPTAKDTAIAVESMKRCGIYHLRDKDCSKMSGGELQMVLIARALSVRPSLLVFDEPESGLDFRNQLVVLRTIRALAGQGISAVVNTHYPEHALRIADKALILNTDGTNFFGNVSSVINESNLRSAFRVKVHIGELAVGENRYHNVIPMSLV